MLLQLVIYSSVYLRALDWSNSSSTPVPLFSLNGSHLLNLCGVVFHKALGAIQRCNRYSVPVTLLMDIKKSSCATNTTRLFHTKCTNVLIARGSKHSNHLLDNGGSIIIHCLCSNVIYFSSKSYCVDK